MNLKNEILQVCFDIHEKVKTPSEGQEEILRLFGVVRSYFMKKFELNKEKYQQHKVVVSQLINQAEVDLVGGIWTDKDGKIHYVGLTVTEKGLIMPDFPQMKDVYIADVAQVGLRR